MIKGLLKRFAWLLLILWCLCLILVGAKFAQNNPTPLQVDLIVWVAPEVSSGLALSLTLLLGLALGALMFAPLLLLYRARIRRLKTQMVRLESRRNEHLLTPLRG